VGACNPYPPGETRGLVGLPTFLKQKTCLLTQCNDANCLYFMMNIIINNSYQNAAFQNDFLFIPEDES
jgi:hypothetical protein